MERFWECNNVRGWELIEDWKLRINEYVLGLRGGRGRSFLGLVLVEDLDDIF